MVFSGMSRGLLVLLCICIFGLSAVQASKQIHLILGDRPSDVWAYWVAPSALSDSKLEYGLTSQGYAQFSIPAIENTTYHLLPAGSSMYKAVMTNLQPITSYDFRVGADSDSWSSVHTFTSPVSDVSTTSRVIVLADIDTKSASQKVAAAALAAAPGTSTIMMPGDLAYADGDSTIWDSWFEEYETLLMTTPMVAGVGNHENEDAEGYGFATFDARLRIPSRPSDHSYWFTFTSGPSRWIVISTEHPYDETSEQFAWIKAQLELANEPANRAAHPILIVSGHRPMYTSSSSSGHQSDAAALRAALEPLVIAAQVDLCIFGHVHAYQRTQPVENLKVTNGGITHVVIGTGGASLASSFNDDAWTAVLDDQHHGFLQLDMDGATGKIEGNFISPSGTVQDTFTVISHYAPSSIDSAAIDDLDSFMIHQSRVSVTPASSPSSSAVPSSASSALAMIPALAVFIFGFALVAVKHFRATHEFRAQKFSLSV